MGAARVPKALLRATVRHCGADEVGRMMYVVIRLLHLPRRFLAALWRAGGPRSLRDSGRVSRRRNRSVKGARLARPLALV